MPSGMCRHDRLHYLLRTSIWYKIENKSGFCRSLEALNDWITWFSLPVLILRCTSVDQPCWFVIILIHKWDTTSLFISWTCLHAIHTHHPKSLWLRSLCIYNNSSHYIYEITSCFLSQDIHISLKEVQASHSKDFIAPSPEESLPPKVYIVYTCFLNFSFKFSFIFFSK